MWYNRRMETSLATRFFSKIEKAPSGCWEWIAHTDKDGYGTFNYPTGTSASIGAHRASYDYFYGDIPEGKQINHKCDNPSCVNPTHLYAGTSKDNAEDRDSRGRNPQINKTKCPRGHHYDKMRGDGRACSKCDYETNVRCEKKLASPERLAKRAEYDRERYKKRVARKIKQEEA